MKGEGLDWSWRTSWLRSNRTCRSKEAGAAMFHGLRVHLTLWYCGVLGAALISFGAAVYLCAQYFLLSPIESESAGHAHMRVNDWFTFSSDQACSPFGPPGDMAPPPSHPFSQYGPTSEWVVCFDQNGSLLPGEDTTGVPSAFLTNTLANTALQTRVPASDIVNAGGTIGSIYRYALVVPNTQGNGPSGVMVIGEAIQAQETALSLLMTLLLIVGSIALFGAGLGGLFLANRALVPARLAWANQQRFIADASHELRTPLTLLRADAEVLLRGRQHLDAEDAALLEDIVAEANHMGRLATNLLTLARLDSESFHHEHEVVNLIQLAQEVARRVQAFAEQRGITVGMEQASNSRVIGDPMLLEQAILVLLDNAIKYNRQGGRAIVRMTEKGGQVHLEVEDTGVGITTEHLEHLGKRFYRVDKARSREAGGTGLSIARNIAIAHGGQLNLSSAPEQGTTVTLILLLARKSQTAPLALS